MHLTFSSDQQKRYEASSLVTFPPISPLQTDRQYEAHQAHRSSKPPKDSYLVEQVFSPHHFPPTVKSHVKGSPLYTDLRLTGLVDGKRSQPSWTIEEYKRNSGDKNKLSALDLQVRGHLAVIATLPILSIFSVL